MNNNQYLRQQLTNEELLVVNSEVQRKKKSATATYLLCLFLGTLGLHRYYMQKNGSAIVMTLITVLTLGIGTIVTAIWALVDLFLISGWLRTSQDHIENEIAQEIIQRREL